MLARAEITLQDKYALIHVEGEPLSTNTSETSRYAWFILQGEEVFWDEQGGYGTQGDARASGQGIGSAVFHVTGQEGGKYETLYHGDLVLPWLSF